MKKDTKGQIALIVLLVLVIMLTVGLAIVSRTVTELKVSEHQKEAVRAFSAAEAGIEQVLKDVALYAGKTNEPVVVGDLKAYVTTTPIDNNVETEIKKNGSTKIDLDGAVDTLTTLTIYWVSKDPTKSEENPTCTGEDQTPASLEIIVYNKNVANYSAKRYAYNACDALDNGFDTPDDGGSEFLKKVDISVDTIAPGQDKLVSIRAIYRKTTVKVVGNENLPVQQYRVTSRATATGGETKAVEVSRTVSALPEIFDYVLFSGGDLVK